MVFTRKSLKYVNKNHHKKYRRSLGSLMCLFIQTQYMKQINYCLTNRSIDLAIAIVVFTLLFNCIAF